MTEQFKGEDQLVAVGVCVPAYNSRMICRSKLNWCRVYDRLLTSAADAPAVKVVSQCFNSDDEVSFVTLYCGYPRVIDVDRAVHGHRPADTSLTDHCDVLATDCLADVTGHYNWSACRRHRHCVHSLRHFDDTDQQRCANNHQPTYLQVS